MNIQSVIEFFVFIEFGIEILSSVAIIVAFRDLVESLKFSSCSVSCYRGMQHPHVLAIADKFFVIMLGRCNHASARIYK